MSNRRWLKSWLAGLCMGLGVGNSINQFEWSSWVMFPLILGTCIAYFAIPAEEKE